MGTGSYEIKELTAQDSVLKDLTIGTKVLENTTAGTIAIPSNQAFGTWEFDFYNDGGSNRQQINFISDRPDASITDFFGYNFVNYANNIYLVKRNEGTFNILFTTKVSIDYTSDNTWYRIKVARLQSEGVFKDIETLQTSDLVERGSEPLDSFTSDRYSCTAIKTQTDKQALFGTADEIRITSGAKYLIEFDAINTNDKPMFSLRYSLGGSSIQDETETDVSDGRNSIVITANQTTTGVVQFAFLSSKSGTTTISDLTIRRIYPANTFAVFIRGGIYTPESSSTGWHLVSTTGGSGQNPIQDSTYSSSEFIVLDLDSGDKFSNLVVRDSVEQ
jgi:hypothetical protein